MKITRRQLRQIIREMAFKKNLGTVDSADDQFSSFNKIAATDNYEFLGDYERPVFDPGAIKRMNKQKKAASVYAKGSSFNKEAEKRFGYMNAKVCVLAQIGSFCFKNGTISKSQFNKFVGRQRGNFDSRLKISPLNQSAKNFLKKVKPDIDLSTIEDNDCIIYYQTDFINIGNHKFQMTPWMIMHAIFDSELMRNKLTKLGHDIGNLQNTSPGFSKRVIDILTMKSAITQRKGPVPHQQEQYRNYFLNDDLAEMVCQELLTKNGLRLNIAGLTDYEVEYLKNLKQKVSEVAKWFDNYIKGKLIVVNGHLASADIVK